MSEIKLKPSERIAQIEQELASKYGPVYSEQELKTKWSELRSKAIVIYLDEKESK